jgi:hypothetical protein
MFSTKFKPKNKEKGNKEAKKKGGIGKKNLNNESFGR